MEFHNKQRSNAFLFFKKKFLKPINLSLIRVTIQVTLFLTLALVAGTASAAELTTQDVLGSISDKGVLPNLANAAQTAAALDKSARLFCKTPNINTLEHTRMAWKTAYLAWRQAESFIYGSAAKIEKKIDVWPANTVVIDAAVEDTQIKYMLNTPDTRGFAGLEHMLYAPPASAATEGRCSHLLSITGEIAKDTAQVKMEWETQKADSFKHAGNGEPFLLPEDALSLLVARVLNVTEVLLRDRIAVPSNFFEKPSRPDSLEAWLSRTSVSSMKATLTGIRQAVVGDGRTGITTLVATKDGLYESKDPELARDIQKQLDKIDNTLSKLDSAPDLYKQVKKKPATLKKLYKYLNKLQEQIVEAALVLEIDVRSGTEIQLTQ